MVGMAPPLLVVTPTKGHMGWDEPVADPAATPPNNGGSPKAAFTEPGTLEV